MEARAKAQILMGNLTRRLERWRSPDLQRLGIGAHCGGCGAAYERPQVQRADLSYKGGAVETEL
jgi:hypothetical protein